MIFLGTLRKGRKYLVSSSSSPLEMREQSWFVNTIHSKCIILFWLRVVCGIVVLILFGSLGIITFDSSSSGVSRGGGLIAGVLIIVALCIFILISYVNTFMLRLVFFSLMRKTLSENKSPAALSIIGNLGEWSFYVGFFAGIFLPIFALFHIVWWSKYKTYKQIVTI